jgi:hypothetical protein
MSRSFLLRMRNFSDKGVHKSKHTFYVQKLFPPKSCRLWDNVEKYCRAGQATDGHIIRRILFVCRITKATDTHSEYVILIAFARQQWLRERDTILHYSCIARLVCGCLNNQRRPNTSLYWQHSGISYNCGKAWRILTCVSGMVLHANRRVDLAASWEALPSPMSVSPRLRHRWRPHCVNGQKIRWRRRWTGSLLLLPGR